MSRRALTPTVIQNHWRVKDFPCDSMRSRGMNTATSTAASLRYSEIISATVFWPSTLETSPLPAEYQKSEANCKTGLRTLFVDHHRRSSQAGLKFLPSAFEAQGEGPSSNRLVKEAY